MIQLLFLILVMNTNPIYDFNKNSPPKDWQIVDDGVMGGLSKGKFSIDSNGNGIFKELFIIKNNGGFSSIRHQFKAITVKKNSKVLFRLKGDGKEYQFRIKDKNNNYFSYISSFKTTGNWEVTK